MIGDFLDGELRVMEEGFGLGNDEVADPLRGTLAAIVLNGHGEVFRRDTELVGIELHGALLLMIGGEEVHESLKEEAAAAGGGTVDLRVRLVFAHEADDAEQEGLEEALDDVVGLGCGVR